MGRYRIPNRKIKTRRGQLKREQNAWCIRCRQPMERHGKSFCCRPCHWATQIVGTYSRARTFADRSLSITGKVRHFADTRQAYPWCIHCKRRMVRTSRNLKRHTLLRWLCLNCGQSCAAVSRIRRLQEEKRHEVLKLLNEGWPQEMIRERLKVGSGTVKELAQRATPRLCACGRIYRHRQRCLQRRWQDAVQNRRSAFDDLLLRVNRKLQSGLPNEMRAELVSMMLVDIMKDIDVRLNRAQDYVRKYKRMYPLTVSLDDNPRLTESLVG